MSAVIVEDDLAEFIVEMPEVNPGFGGAEIDIAGIVEAEKDPEEHIDGAAMGHQTNSSRRRSRS